MIINEKENFVLEHLRDRLYQVNNGQLVYYDSRLIVFEEGCSFPRNLNTNVLDVIYIQEDGSTVYADRNTRKLDGLVFNARDFKDCFLLRAEVFNDLLKDTACEEVTTTVKNRLVGELFAQFVHADLADVPELSDEIDRCVSYDAHIYEKNWVINHLSSEEE